MMETKRDEEAMGRELIAWVARHGVDKQLGSSSPSVAAFMVQCLAAHVCARERERSWQANEQRLGEALEALSTIEQAE